MAIFLKPHGNSASEKFLRIIGMVVVLGIVAWAFWTNNQSTLEKIQARNSLWDQTKVLSKSERNFVQGFIRSMRNEFGVQVKIHILTDHIAPKQAEPKELYIKLSPAFEEVDMQFPGLVRHALGSKFISELKKNYFTENFSDDKWPTALMTSLSMIWERLAKVESDQSVIPVYSESDSGNEDKNMTDPESAGFKE
ncbi:hypothetical protein [Maridesulfovibrio zosterae]|uniref:hypothetical protein n=1 Tax=Maridesulfovibrio zosterae TaxID=82171 RepID=UPI0003F8FAD2|nr:hypothetical protein [Maridesulfovibrio zosterae]